jgi:hypothetical protein
MTTYKDLVAEFNNPLFVSAALDELLDAGLLRAEDGSPASSQKTYTRMFLSGGEYNAVQVSRIADTWRAVAPVIDPLLILEEAIELWP